MMENNNTAFFICYVKLLRYQLKTPLISVPVLEQSNFAIGGEGGGGGAVLLQAHEDIGYACKPRVYRNGENNIA